MGESWGRVSKQQQREYILTAADAAFPHDQSLLTYGLGRSYGDSCLNSNGVQLTTRQLDHFIDFDRNTGILVAQAGVTLAQIIELTLPHGWFPMVSPGTKLVTLGGAIANDVHGKNHHRVGSFGCHVLELTLRRSEGATLRCSPNENSELFAATIGGLGLTGLITQATIRLRQVSGPLIDQELIRFGHVDEFFSLVAESDRRFEYTVAWIDGLARAASLGRGIFMRANHSIQPAEINARHTKFGIPVELPALLLNPATIGAFNNLYYWGRASKTKRRVSYEPFFYPLDAINRWNLLYGKRGLVQFQCVVPQRQAIEELLVLTSRSRRASFLAVLKQFGAITSPGLLSFARAGFTLCMDFPYEQAATRELFSELEKVVLAAGGAIYPAKDHMMSGASFRAFYPHLERFKRSIDGRFASDFWRRVNECD